MANRDLHHSLVIKNALNIQTIGSNTTTVGEIIDLQGYESCEIVFQTGTVTDGDYAVLIEDGDASNLSDAAAVADKFLLGTEAGASFTADTNDNKTGKIGYIGDKRYVRLSIVSTGTTTGAVVGATAILGNRRHIASATESQVQ